MKGSSSAVALLVLFVTLAVVVVPALMLLNEVPVYNSQGRFQGSAMLQLKDEQNNQVFRGNPNIYYNSSSAPSLQFYFNSLPAHFNISQIYYFNGTVWVPVLKSYLVLSGNAVLPLPPKAYGRPVIILTALGNIYLVNPNTSVTTASVSGPKGEVPIYILSYVVNGSRIIPISIQVVLGSNPPALTPVVYYVSPGTYTVSNKNGSMIFLSKYYLTAVFETWALVGQGSIDSQSPQSVTLTVDGPTVLAAVYVAVQQKFQVNVKALGIPLGATVSGSNANVKLTSLNSTIPVIIDNKTYYVGPNGLSLNLTFGYHVVAFPTQYNITFNYTYSSGGVTNTVPAGQISTYNFTSLTTSTKAIQVVSGSLIFVNGSGVVYGNYKAVSTYYLITVKNNYYLPSGYTLAYNTTPVLGDVAGQLLEVNETYLWGPSVNYVPQRFYVLSGTEYRVTYDYLNEIYGNFTLKYGGSTYSYEALLTTPVNVVIQYANGKSITINISSETPSNNPYFTVNMPITVINYELWGYGGYPAG